MSDRAVIYGIINGAMAEPANWRRFHDYNRRVIEQLPTHDDHPPLVRGMFAISDERPLMWQSQPIHFGWSTKNFSEYWNAWLPKLEDLLRRLCWWEARLHIEAELEGTLTCRWNIHEASITIWRQTDPPDFANTWDLEMAGDFIGAQPKGHRDPDDP